MITNIKIIYVSADVLYPAFGYAFPSRRIIFIGNWLPESLKNAVMEHEKYHLRDKSKNVLWRELKANFYALRKHPVGQLQVLFRSVFDLNRWKMYWKRFRNEKKVNDEFVDKLRPYLR